MLHIVFECTFVDFLPFLLKFSKAIKFPFLEFANILETWSDQLAKAIGFTVPNLTLVNSAISKLVASLACASTIFPLSCVDVSTLKFLAALTMLLSICKVAGINVSSLKS